MIFQGRKKSHSKPLSILLNYLLLLRVSIKIFAAWCMSFNFNISQAGPRIPEIIFARQRILMEKGFCIKHFSLFCNYLPIKQSCTTLHLYFAFIYFNQVIFP